MYTYEKYSFSNKFKKKYCKFIKQIILCNKYNFINNIYIRKKYRE